MDDLEKYITETYLNILGRPPDPGGLKGWVYLITTKQIKKELLAKELTNHEEYKKIPQTQTVAPIQKVTPVPVSPQPIKNDSGRKVAFIMENFSFYSGGRYLSYMIALAFQEIGFDVTLYTDRKPSEIPYINNDDFKDYKKPGIECVTDLSKLNFSKQSYDMYIGAPTDGCLVAHREAMKNKKPYITFLFDVPPFMKKYSGDLDRGWVNHTVWDKVSETLKDADLIFTFSKTLIPYIQEFGKLESIRKIKVFHPPTNSRVCAKAGARDKKRQVLMINRFVKNKHWDHLFEAISMIDNPPNLIAMTRSENEIKELALKHEVAVNCIIYADDLTKFKLIKESAVIVNPSSYEGLSMSTAEAITCNTPCVVYEFPIMRDIFGEMGISYAKYLDPMSLKNKIELLINNKEIQAAKTAEARSVEHLFTFDNFSEELFEELFNLGFVERSFG